MTTHRRVAPPVIPEIAKAYQNDPRTQLALASMKGGMSTAPVAQGGYAWADGIARALQGVAGGYIDRKQQEKYGADQDELLALRKARGVDELSGAGNPAAPVASATAPAAAAPAAPTAPTAPQAAPSAPPPPPGAPANASAVASALGAPPPDPQPPGQGPTQMALAQPQGPMAVPPSVTPGTGGGPNGRAPFSAARLPAPSGLQAPNGNPTTQPPTIALKAHPPAVVGLQDVPNDPAPLDIKALKSQIDAVAPQAPAATKSRLLDQAYRIMADANPYESERGQDMYEKGLADQTELDDKAAARKFDLDKTSWSAAAGAYVTDQENSRSDQREQKRNVVQNNFSAVQNDAQRRLTASEGAATRASELQRTRMTTAAELEAARIKASVTSLTSDEQDAINKAVGDKRLDLKGLSTRNQKLVAQALIANPGLNAIQLHGLATLDANPAAQQKASTLEALPTIVSNVRDAGKKLNYSDVQFIGKVQKYAKGQLNDPNFTNYMTQRADVLSTIASVMGNTGASDFRTKLEDEAAHPTMSPRALDGWLQGQMSAMHPRIAIAEKKGLIDPGTTARLEQAYGLKPMPGMAPAAATSGGKTGNPLVDKYLGH